MKRARRFVHEKDYWGVLKEKWIIQLEMAQEQILGMDVLVSVSSRSQSQMASAILHEIGHYLAAPPSRKRRKDFGIPPGTRGMDFWDYEDDCAVLAENHMYKRLGFGAPTSITTFRSSKRAIAWWERVGLEKTNQVLRLVGKSS